MQIEITSAVGIKLLNHLLNQLLKSLPRQKHIDNRVAGVVICINEN